MTAQVTQRVYQRPSAWIRLLTLLPFCAIEGLNAVDTVRLYGSRSSIVRTTPGIKKRRYYTYIIMYSMGGSQQANRFLATTALAVVMVTAMVAITPSVPLTTNRRNLQEQAASAVGGGDNFRALKTASSAAGPR